MASLHAFTHNSTPLAIMQVPVLVFVKGKADAEIIAKKLERLEWVLYACHAESEEDMVNQS